MKTDEASQALTPLERLIAIEEIKQLKARYWRSLDLQDWNLFASVFAPEVVVDFREGSTDPNSTDTMFPAQLRGEVIQGKIKWLDVVKRNRALRNSEGAVSMHHGHMPEIEILSPTTARGLWAMEDMVFWPAERGKKTTHGFGFYEETYAKLEDAWKIASMRLRRMRVAPISG